MKKLTAKIFIKGTIETLTGLHVGGNSSSMEIGGIDNEVIKSGNGIPFIPGSSLKGKMRTLLAKVRGYEKVETDKGDVLNLFGNSGGKDNNITTRLIVRDAQLDLNSFNNTFGKKEVRTLDLEFTEDKPENTIDRSSSSANPRHMERVPAGAIFNFSLILDIYEGDVTEDFLALINEAFQLIELDYIGGQGSRGSGQVKFLIDTVSGKKISEEGISVLDTENFKEIFSEFIPV